MKNYKTNEEVEKDFDKEFEPSNFYSQIRPDLIIIKLKSFISSLRLQDKQFLLDEINEWAEKDAFGVDNMFTEIINLSDLQAYIKSLRK